MEGSVCRTEPSLSLQRWLWNTLWYTFTPNRSVDCSCSEFSTGFSVPDNRLGLNLHAGGVEKIISLFRAFFVPLHDYWIINEYI